MKQRISNTTPSRTEMNAVVTPSTTPTVIKTIVTKLGNVIVYDFSSDEEDTIRKSSNEDIIPYF